MHKSVFVNYLTKGQENSNEYLRGTASVPLERRRSPF